MIKKRYNLLIMMLCIYCNVFAQPSGEERFVTLYFIFTNAKGDTIHFKKKNNILISLDNKNQIEVYKQGFKCIIDNEKEYYDIFFKEKKTIEDSIVICKWKKTYVINSMTKINLWKEDKSKFFNLLYYPSFRRLGDCTNQKKNDIIVKFKSNNKLMKVTFKLYSTKGIFEGGSEVTMNIQFKEGNFEVINPKEPKLNAIKGLGN